MTATVLSDGRVWRLPAGPFVLDDAGRIVPPSAEEISAVAPAIRETDLLPFACRLIKGSQRRRHQMRWSRVNRCRLELARLCIERALVAAAAEAPPTGEASP